MLLGLIIIIIIIYIYIYLCFNNSKPLTLFNNNHNNIMTQVANTVAPYSLVWLIIVTYSVITGICSTFGIEKVKLSISNLFWTNNELYYWSFFITTCSIFIIVTLFLEFIFIIEKFFKISNNSEEEEEMNKVELTTLEDNFFVFLIVGIYSTIVGVCITLGIQNGKLFIKTLFCNIHFLFFYMILAIFIIIICFLIFYCFTFDFFWGFMEKWKCSSSSNDKMTNLKKIC